MRKYSSLLAIISMQLGIMSSFAIASDVKTDICNTAFNVVAAAVVSRNSGTPKDDVKKKWLASVEKMFQPISKIMNQTITFCS